MEKGRARRGWLKIASIVVAVAVVGRGLAERQPERLHLIAMIAMIGLAVVGAGWLFANRRR